MKLKFNMHVLTIDDDLYGYKKKQRTNGTVNAHLISGPTSTKTSFHKFDIVLKWVKVNSGSSCI